MSLKYTLSKKILHFKQPAGTSRGVYTTRKIWLVHLTDGERTGMGECAPLPDLSCDALPDETYESKLNSFCQDLCQKGDIDVDALRPYPSMLFGLETALLNLWNGDLLFDTPFSRGEEGIPINGLVWMGRYDEMLQRMEEKLEKGFRCVKLKIGAIDFEQELDLVKRIRDRFSFHEVELRLDANGAFKYEEALYKLELLSQYAIHSIEQPEMKGHMLNVIKPRYIILKPSLHGGMMGCREWIETAKQQGIGSWITSALESNIGLNAIAQFASDVYGPHIRMPQGLGTGQLFTDNIPMPLEIRGDMLFFDIRTKET